MSLPVLSSQSAAARVALLSLLASVATQHALRVGALATRLVNDAQGAPDDTLAQALADEALRVSQAADAAARSLHTESGIAHSTDAQMAWDARTRVQDAWGSTNRT